MLFPICDKVTCTRVCLCWSLCVKERGAVCVRVCVVLAPPFAILGCLSANLFLLTPSLPQGPFSGRNFTNSSMVGIGLTPEGINQNDVVYEFMMENTWRPQPLNDTGLAEW